jgi:hypothetical protein
MWLSSTAMASEPLYNGASSLQLSRGDEWQPAQMLERAVVTAVLAALLRPHEPDNF